MLDKGKYGYIDNYKKRKFIIAMILLALSLGIYFGAYFYNGRSNQNIFTVISIILILPMAKFLVAWIVALPFKTISKELYNEIEDKKGNGVVLYDLIVTSSEKVMNMDCIYVTDSMVMLLVNNKKQKKDYIKDYIENYLKINKYDRKVKIFVSNRDYIKSIGNENNENLVENKMIAEDILILQV